MKRRLSAETLGLAAVVAVTALAIALVAWGTRFEEGGTGEQPAALEDGDVLGSAGATPSRSLLDGIEARGSLAPSSVFFGDSVAATVNTVLDPRRIDPDSVQLVTDFAPWEIVGQPLSTRRDSEQVTHLRTTYTLRCLSGACVPVGQLISIQLPPARMSFTRRGASGRASGNTQIEWPILPVYSRSAASVGQARGAMLPWRGDLLTSPAVSYRLSQSLAVALAFAGSVLFGAAAITLGVVLWRRRIPAPPPEPEPLPEIELTPLEQALVMLEDASRSDGAADRRRALELVSEELEAQDAGLAATARILAWSEETPRVEVTTQLAARIRALIAVEQGADEDDDEERGGLVV